MPFSFLSPLALAAIALIAVPWWLHHIRRAERRPQPFSSLMFVPVVKERAVRRLRLQHLALMALRMLVLILLALTFARPYLSRVVAAPQEAAARHVILIDTSYSMGAEDRFERAKREARRIADGLNTEAQVAVIAFGETPHRLNSLAPPADASAAIDAAKLTLEKTNYEAALRSATEVLIENPQARTGEHSVIHLISDFQRAGMPVVQSAWKMPTEISLDPVVVGTVLDNASVVDLHVAEASQGGLILRAKIKNWSHEKRRTFHVRLVVDGKPSQAKTVEIPPGNASQVAFALEPSEAEPLTGWVEIDDASLVTDNRRNFAWNPARKQHVQIVKSPDRATRWPVEEMIRLALSGAKSMPWLGDVTPTLAGDSFDGDRIVLVSDFASLEPAQCTRLVDGIRKGGKALVVLGADVPDDRLLAGLGLRLQKVNEPERGKGSFASLSWIDFEHPAFRAFSDSRFNDFSDIHVFRHPRVEVVPDSLLVAPRVIGKFGGEDPAEESPAVLDVPLGTGRVLIWAFSLDLASSNLAKTSRFVPMLYEALSYLAPRPDKTREWLVGQQPVPPFSDFRAYESTGPSADESVLDTLNVEQTGFIHWRSGNPGEQEFVEPANVDAGEGDLTTVTPAEFALRLTSAPIAAEETTVADASGRSIAEAKVEPWEFGRFMLAVVLVALLGEIWYAGRLSQTNC